jgi:hypothetical protein
LAGDLASSAATRQRPPPAVLVTTEKACPDERAVDGLHNQRDTPDPARSVQAEIETGRTAERPNPPTGPQLGKQNAVERCFGECSVYILTVGALYIEGDPIDT